MMISPDGYIEGYKNKPYKELLTVRDKLLEETRAFEDHTYNPELEMILYIRYRKTKRIEAQEQ